MQIDKGKITAVQFMFSVACYMQASSLLTAFFVGITKQDSWIVVILAFLVCLPFLFIFISIMRNFPDKNLIQINTLVFGPVVGNIISAMYIWYFLTLTSLNLRDLSDFVHQTIMPKTPSIVIMFLFLLVCAWAVRFGIGVVTRYNTLFSIIQIVILALAVVFTANLIDFQNFLPMFDQPAMEYVHGTHVVSTIPFGEVVVFLMITPNIKLPPKKISKFFLWGFVIGGIVLVVVILRDTAVLGNVLGLFSLPSFETQRMASLMEALSRLEIMFASVLIILLFAKVTFLYYVTVLSLAQIFKFETFKPFILSIGALAIVYAFILYSSSMQHVESGTNATPILWTLFEFVLPMLTLLIAKMRKLPQTEEVV
ncbi:MAG: spore gernimation protein [Oscillospiraceae bacterium]|jgi:spore germination protein KB|nr:spore gernimation protein [Oscillospiraceae bacterium]